MRLERARSLSRTHYDPPPRRVPEGVRMAPRHAHGEMARPPQLGSEIPKVRADWQWAGEWWVSANTDMRLANTRWNRVNSVEQIR